MQPHTWENREGRGFSPGTVRQSADSVRSGALTPADLVEACGTAVRQDDWWNAALLADQGLRMELLVPEQEGRLRFYAGLAVMYLGDLLRAERELLTFLRLSELEPALRDLIGPATYNLGHVYRTLGRPEDESRWFSTALAEYERAGNVERVTTTLADIAWCYLCWGKAAEGLSNLERAAARVTFGSENELHVNLGLALYHSINGEVDQSERVLTLLEAQGELQARFKAEIHWLRGGNLLARGDVEGATLQVELAYEAAMADWWPELLGRIDGLRNRIRRRAMV